MKGQIKDREEETQKINPLDWPSQLSFPLLYYFPE